MDKYQQIKVLEAKKTIINSEISTLWREIFNDEYYLSTKAELKQLLLNMPDGGVNIRKNPTVKTDFNGFTDTCYIDNSGNLVIGGYINNDRYMFSEELYIQRS